MLAVAAPQALRSAELPRRNHCPNNPSHLFSNLNRLNSNLNPNNNPSPNSRNSPSER